MNTNVNVSITSTGKTGAVLGQANAGTTTLGNKRDRYGGREDNRRIERDYDRA